MEFTVPNMQKLAELLRPPEPEVLQGDDLPSTGMEITASRKVQSRIENTEKGPKTIEEFEEQEAIEAENLSRTGAGAGERKTPVYSMVYQQAVSAEDVFLQIGPKTPSSASCEHLVVRIKMTGDKCENVDLKVDTGSVSVSSSRYFLKLPLPHEIDPDGSKASWDANGDTLILTLKLEREFDFINF